MKNQQQNIIAEIVAERQRQDAKFGANRTHHPLEWLAILTEETGEVSKAVVEGHFAGYPTTGTWREYRAELIQVAAVALAMVESHDYQSRPIQTDNDSEEKQVGTLRDVNGKCPECLDVTSLDELKMFGGLCEVCAVTD